jgi:hypothetical protein
MTKMVVGRPRIITENFDDITTYFGLIKCTVLPPRGLFHPVLPYRTQGKLMFPLCKACADTCNQAPCTHSERERAIQGTWCSVELEKALEKGYHILQMHEVWHFPETSEALFKDYVDTFLKIKQESSGCQELYHRGTETAVRRRILGSRRNTVRSRKDRTQSWDACIVQTDAEFVLGYVF